MCVLQEYLPSGLRPQPQQDCPSERLWPVHSGPTQPGWGLQIFTRDPAGNRGPASLQGGSKAAEGRGGGTLEVLGAW